MQKQQSNLQLSQSRASGGRAFTLVELMISIAMVVILLIGINQVFQYTTQAVSVGQSISSAVRDSRAAQTAFNQDLGNAATNDGPFIIIHNAQVYAFRNRADLAGSKTQDASKIDINGDGVEGDTNVPGENISPATYNYRNHRVDVLSFFSRGVFPAQTGDTQFVYPNTASTEARIWYGFLKLPDGSYLNPIDAAYSGTTSYRFPGLTSGQSTIAGSASATNGSTASNNPNNFFATDWVLGRVATLLIPNPLVSSYYSYNNTGNIWTSADNPTAHLSPLSDDTTVKDSAGTTWHQQWSRFDVAKTSITSYTNQLQAYITANPNTSVANGGWANGFYVSSMGKVTGELFQCNPFVTTFSTNSASSTITPPAKMARTTPYFLKGCTQFTVEFAGDFVKQDDNPNDVYNGSTVFSNYGDVIDYVTTSNGNADGIDYVLVPTFSPTGAVNPRSMWTKKIRWYGLPRNASGGMAVLGNQGASYTPSSGTFGVGSLHDAFAAYVYPNPTDSTAMPEVVPLRDVIACLPAAKLTAATGSLNALLQAQAYNCWPERILPGNGVPGNGETNYTASGVAGMTNGSDYLVAWGPDSDAIGIPRPKMIRITMTLDDQASPNKDGQTYQYVFALPQ